MNNQSPLDGALKMHSRGFKVFPLRPNTKTPAESGWQEWAKNSTESTIRDYAATHPNANWGVAVYQSGHTGVDIDCKEGAKGFQSVQELEAKGKKLSDTFTIGTPTGGKHMYYVGVCGGNTASRLGEGIDTRGQGGYLVAPGSTINGREYKIIEDRPIAELPKWIPEALQQEKAQKAVTTVKSAENMIPKGQRNAALTSLAGTMRNKGMSQEAIEAALIAENKISTEEPLPLAEIQNIAKSVSKYPPAIGSSSSSNGGFGTLKPFIRQSAADIVEMDIPPRQWIMDKHFIGGFITGTFSMPGVGKSSFTMLEAVAVATGKSLTGYEVLRKGAVWIFNLEDPKEEIQRRIIAIAKHYNISKEEMAPIYYDSGREHPLNIARAGRDNLEINEDLIQEVIKEIKERDVRLLILDPLVRCHEIPENDNTKIDKVVLALQRIATETGCAINLVHHTNKNGTEGTGGTEDAALARGASSFIGSVREARFLNYPKPKDIKIYGLQEGEDYVFVYNPKANLAKREKDPRCYRHIGLTLGNGDSVGVLDVVRLHNQTDKITKERRENERIKIAPVLCRELNQGQEKALKEILEAILEDAQAATVFKHFKKIELKGKRLCKLLKETLEKSGKKFSIQRYPERRSKYYVKCE